MKNSFKLALLALCFAGSAQSMQQKIAVPLFSAARAAFLSGGSLYGATVAFFNGYPIVKNDLTLSKAGGLALGVAASAAWSAHVRAMNFAVGVGSQAAGIGAGALVGNGLANNYEEEFKKVERQGR